MEERKIYKLSDKVIAQVAKLLQVALLSGTNVVDNLRMMRLEPGKEVGYELVPTIEYEEWFNNTIQGMLEFAQQEQTGREEN